ncbi:MAG TPA: hypothetical protein VFQ35_08115 [Polyangiaceae bacterium]|nr:hypothetical protein [Polyangiaceae bacterium]
MGTRTCSNGVWSACSVTRHVTKFAPQSGDKHLLALATTPESCHEPCDPNCSVFIDTPPGIDPGNDFTLKGGTLTLPARAGGGSCAQLRLSPSDAVITVTSLTPLVTDPPTIQFSATCGLGDEPIQPSWVLRASDADVARIDGNGVLRALAALPKTVQVTAATAAGQASATVDVRVNIDEVDADCDATLFSGSTSGVDPGKTLYPYSVPARPVVFPLGLPGPLVQWSTGGVTADCVKVSLEFPRGAPAPKFHWSRVYSSAASATDPKVVDSTQPAAPIPDDVWKAFSSAAAGQVTDIQVQRYPEGAPAPLEPLPAIPLKFANDSIRGTAFFTQYLRRLRDDQNLPSVNICGDPDYGQQPDLDIRDTRFRTDSASGCVNGDCSANSAPSCPVGGCTQAVTFRSQVATLQALDLSNPSLGLTDPFGASSANRCTACHSISADGRTLVAGDYSSSGLQTIARLDTIGGRAHANPIADAPTYSWTSSRGDSIQPEREQSKGLSYAALTPDGRYVLQGANFWGNTDHDVLLGSENLQDAGYPAGGRRYFLLDVRHYRKNVQFATNGPLPSHTFASGTLTGTANGPLTIDGNGVAVGDSVLVKDQPTASENGVYTVAVSRLSSPFRLVRRVEDGAVPLGFGDKFRVEHGDTNAGKYFHLASPMGAITPDVTPLTFALYDTVMTSTSRALPAHNYLLGGDGVPILTGSGTFDSDWIDDVPPENSMSVLVKNEVGANAIENGIYELVDANSNPWVLRRRSEADSDPELVGGARVRVNQGTRFGGMTFVLEGTGVQRLGVASLLFPRDTSSLDEGMKYDRGGTPSTLPTMMFPSFSPDGQSLVYVNGDSDTLGTTALATGWRRGLSLLSFNANAAVPFSGKRRLLNSYDSSVPGTVFKWPFFEHDSRSVIFQASAADEFCPLEAYQGHCTGPDCAASTEGIAVDSDLERACFKWSDWKEYGHGNGAPTARGYWPGRLESVNTTTLVRTALAHANAGLADQDATRLAADAAKSYQPNVVPFTAGGYRWVVFTSTRAYGNQLNPVGTHFTCAMPLLWMAALDDTGAGSDDRSYPAFLLPGQNLRSIFAETTQPPFGRHYLNERAYVVPSACKGEHAPCTADGDCCDSTGATPTLQCRLNTTTDPPSRSCEAASSCRATGDGCNADGDCCSGLCVEKTCSTSPVFSRAVYTRIFASNCPSNYKVRWGNLEWHANAPSSTHIDFRASVADAPDGFSGGLFLASANMDNVNVPPADLQRVDVGAALEAAEIPSAQYLRITMEFFPSDDGFTAPVLYDWDQRFDCLDAE